MNERTLLFVSDLHLIGLIIQKREENPAFFLFLPFCATFVSFALHALIYSNFHLSTIIIHLQHSTMHISEWVMRSTDTKREPEKPEQNNNNNQMKKMVMMMMMKKYDRHSKAHTAFNYQFLSLCSTQSIMFTAFSTACVFINVLTYTK